MADLQRQSKIGPLVDGMRSLLAKNLVAHTRITSNAYKGDTSINVDNSIRFRADDQIIIFNDQSSWDDDIGSREGIEFHTVISDPTETGVLLLKEPLGRDFLVSDKSRLQKAIEFAVLDSKDIYYGDRASLTFNEVAICIEPEKKSNEWLAIGGLGSYEYRMAIMVYVKVSGAGDVRDEDRAARVCHSYADAIEDLLIRNIHVDLTIEEVPLLEDVCYGDSWAFIPKSQAHKWQPDHCPRYEVQDNFHADQDFYIIDPKQATYSSSESSCVSFDISTSSGSLFSSLSSDSGSELSTSTFSSLSTFNNSSSSSYSSVSQSESSTPSVLSLSSASSVSSIGNDAYQVFFSCPVNNHLRVSDKAVLRRKARYMYDSRVDDVEYGNVAKDSFMLKGARLSWFGKESRHLPFPQVGLGGETY